MPKNAPPRAIRDANSHRVEGPADVAVDAPQSFNVGGQSTMLVDFLERCLASFRGGHRGDESIPDNFYAARNLFVSAGVAALVSAREDAAWIQRGVRPAQDAALRRECCRRVRRLALELLADGRIDDFFFMHKPPGIRLRFRCAASLNQLRHVVDAELASWHSEGLIEASEAGVYEPESALFGGPASMSFVHALFTVDSLLWLAYHGREPDAAQSDPAWLVSLAVLATLLTGLDITGWEDLGVWEQVRLHGRRRREDANDSPLYAEVSGDLRDVWSRRDLIVELLSPSGRAILEEHRDAVLAGAAAWRAGYFAVDGALLGPRAAAAMYVIFHWNRAEVSDVNQALIAESLARRMVP